MRVFLLILLVLIVLTIAGIVGSEYYTSQPEFCNVCHVMKRYYGTWKDSKHGEKNVACVECHYAPGEKPTPRAKIKGLKHLTTYLTLTKEEREKQVYVPTKVSDASCMTSGCHPKEKFVDKKVKFTEKIPYIHKTHEEKTIEGQKLHCSTCHMHRSADKHFEVPKEACNLCHFKNAPFNEGRSKCSLCHEIPTKPLQKKKPEPGAKLITHQTLEKDKVPCYSCHYELIQGQGEIKEKECLDCHEKGDVLESLKKEDKKEILHKAHVEGQNAKCFGCHDYIQHKETDFLDPVRLSCLRCHPDHHISQKVLLAGLEQKGVPETPSLMFDVKTTCLGCHQDERIVKGEKVLHGDPKTCAQCHVEKTAQMVKEWKDSIAKALNEAKELEKEANEAIEMTKTKLPKEKLEKAMAMFKEGQENMQIVEAGGGVHNQKYSIQLLDVAMNNFEDAIDLLKE
jgi:nitrate/TMAO reductase-like tetraheme cytochrome c subunit